MRWSTKVTDDDLKVLREEVDKLLQKQAATRGLAQRAAVNLATQEVQTEADHRIHEHGPAPIALPQW